jgi:two-component system response regulator MprA
VRIAILEDDPDQLALLRRWITDDSHDVHPYTSGREAMKMAGRESFDLFMLDWQVPDVSGAEVLMWLRANVSKSVPVLFVTVRDSEQDIVFALEHGADDYMIKPFNLDELLARVRALLRRTQPERVPVLKFADLTLDTGSRQASRGNRQISLTAKEYELLELFLRHPKQVLTREVIFDRVWGYDFGGESNVLEVYIRYLRQKLEGEDEARLIHTVRGVGYVLRENP